MPGAEAAGIGTRVYLRAVNDMPTIALSAYPADTLTGARVFYTRPTLVHAVRELAGRVSLLLNREVSPSVVITRKRGSYRTH